jgi:hypothetical protein
MCWDDAAFYVAAELEEPHVWATLTARDSVIFHDDDFEVFIDPDGDTHAYAELEINAHGTEWDLLLITPYRDMVPPRRPPIDGWNIAGLRTAVHVDGSINDPSDEDRGWNVEIAIPWRALAELAGHPTPPRSGDVWRINFSRVEWRKEVVDGGYRKALDPRTGEQYREDNWVWSSQGVVDMHRPESWGLVMFAEGDADWPAELDEELAARRVLRALYHAQREHVLRAGVFSSDLDELGIRPRDDLGRWRWPPDLRVTATTWEAVLPRVDGARMHITADGRVWIAPAEQRR